VQGGEDWGRRRGLCKKEGIVREGEACVRNCGRNLAKGRKMRREKEESNAKGSPLR
jgi:hypothetical protein